ncbi:HlyC/CorC family transporter [bacterium]|nr:MAG: HlyC/CorC family transporter [bacterium]
MLLLLAVLCGLVEALFTALEVALGAVSRSRMRSLAEPDAARAEGSEPPPPAQTRRAKAVLALLEHPDRLSILFLSVTSLSLWCAASLLTWHVVMGLWNVGILAGALIALLFVAEVVPLLLAAGHAETIALRGARFLALSQRVLRPLTWLVGGIAFGLARLLGSGPRASPHVTESELRTALATAEEEGTIESGERALIEGAMDLRTQSVRDVMTPRLDIVGISASASLSKALETALDEGHSRLPIYDGTLDKIVGVLATKDLLSHLYSPTANVTTLKVRDVARTPLFVPEQGRVNVVLDELRRNRTLMAIVVDSNGTTAGLVTLEDLLEELVGEIQDEYDAEEAPVRLLNPEKVSEGALPEVVCNASLSVREMGRFFGEELGYTTTLRDATGSPVGSSSSVASLALERFGRVPQVGDQVDVGSALAPVSATSDSKRISLTVCFVVTQMDGPRLLELHVWLIPEEEGNGA